MTSEEKDKIIERIGKLMATASDKGSLHEAEIAARKAQELLLRHNLSMVEVESSLEKGERQVGEKIFDMGKVWKKAEGSWIIYLYSAVAKHNLCTIIQTYSRVNRRAKGVILIGSSDNVEIVHFICNQLRVRIRAIEAEAWSGYHGPEKRGTFRRGFLMGAVNGIRSNLRDQAKDLEQANNNLTALMVVNDVALKEYKDKEHPDLGRMRGGGQSSLDGRAIGFKTGKDMGVRPGLEKGSQGQGRLETGI